MQSVGLLAGPPAHLSGSVLASVAGIVAGETSFLRARADWWRPPGCFAPVLSSHFVVDCSYSSGSLAGCSDIVFAAAGTVVVVAVGIVGVVVAVGAVVVAAVVTAVVAAVVAAVWAFFYHRKAV